MIEFLMNKGYTCSLDSLLLLCSSRILLIPSRCILISYPTPIHWKHPFHGWSQGSFLGVQIKLPKKGNKAPTGTQIQLLKYYKFNILVMLLLAGLTISLNFYFLKNTDLKLIGIALSTAISLTTYNVVKIVFNYIVFKVSPLSIEMIFVSIICTLAITVAIVLPVFDNNFIRLDPTYPHIDNWIRNRTIILFLPTWSYLF